MLSRDSAQWFDDLARSIAEPGLTRRQALKNIALGVLAVSPLRALSATPARASSGRASSCYEDCVKTNNDYNHQFELQCQTHLGPQTDPAEHIVRSLQCMRSKNLLDQEIPHKCLEKCGCPPGLVKCGDRCVNPKTDSQNCGSCGRVCVSPSACHDGHCVEECSGGTVKCNGVCCQPKQICSNNHCCFDCEPGWIKCAEPNDPCGFGCCSPATPLCCPGGSPGELVCCNKCNPLGGCG